MFPNVRLMVAAVVASIMALSFGFGLFAAVRVNHEPLAGPTPLQLAADHVSPPVETLTAGGTFGTRYREVQLPLADPDAGLSALKVSLRDSVEPTNTVALAGPVVGADPQPQSGAAAPVPESNGQQSGAAVDEPAQAASAGSASAPDAPASGLDGAAPAQAAGIAPAPVSEPDAKSAGAGGVSAEPMPAASPQTAAIETPADQAQPVVESSKADTPASAPSTAAATPPKHRHRIVRRKVNRQSVVMMQRARAARVGAIVPSSPPTDNFLQPHFQTAPAPSARSRPAAKAAVKAGAKPVAKTSAAAGPLAIPPSY